MIVVEMMAKMTTMIHHASSLTDKYMNAGAQETVKLFKKYFPHFSPHNSGIQKILYIKTV